MEAELLNTKELIKQFGMQLFLAEKEKEDKEKLVKLGKELLDRFYDLSQE